MKETLKSVFKGIFLGLMMTGFVLSVVEGRILLVSGESYWLLLFYITTLIICLTWVVVFFKEGKNNVTLAISILTAVSLLYW